MELEHRLESLNISFASRNMAVAFQITCPISCHKRRATYINQSVLENEKCHELVGARASRL